MLCLKIFKRVQRGQNFFDIPPFRLYLDFRTCFSLRLSASQDNKIFLWSLLSQRRSPKNFYFPPGRKLHFNWVGAWGEGLICHFSSFWKSWKGKNQWLKVDPSSLKHEEHDLVCIHVLKLTSEEIQNTWHSPKVYQLVWSSLILYLIG